jgi:hypothetical protein
MKTAAAAIAAVLLSAAFGLGACAPVATGGPPLALPAALMDTARAGSITVSSDWLRSEDDFTDTFTDELRQELARCAVGTYPLDVRVHLDRLHRDGRLDVLLTGEGMHTLSGLVEFVDPARGGRVVGRYPVSVGVQAGGRVAGLLGDRQMMVSEAFGRDLCTQAFGRNPRGPAVTRATPG